MVVRSRHPRHGAGTAIAGLAMLLLLSTAAAGRGDGVSPPEAGFAASAGGEVPSVPSPYVALRENEAEGGLGGGGIHTEIHYRPILLSAILPGSGQLVQGQNRGYAYIAAEVATIAGWFVYRNQGQDTENEYIEFAWVHAREGVPGGTGNNIRGTNEYYEHLSKWIRSGEFDTDRNYDLEDPFTIDPWTDEETFNGDTWRIATITFFEPDTLGVLVGERADTLAALQLYSGRAFQSDFYWDWTKNNTVDNYKAQQNRYKDLRDESNAAYRRATVSLVLLMANHVISVVDAFMSSRIEIAGDPQERRTRLDMRPVNGRGGTLGAALRLTRDF